MTTQKKKSIWIWLALGLIILSFVAFILFLDRNIVRTAQHAPAQPAASGNTEKPVFDFYTVLPEREVEIPEVVEPESERPDESSTRKKIAADARYILQVGSFQTVSDADRQKAQLALLGLEAKITSARVNGATYYRVEMGPFDSIRYSSVQKSLIENDVDFLPRKLP